MVPHITTYRATSSQGALQSVDFSTVGGKSYAFFQLYNPEEVAAFQKKITAAPFHQEVVSVTAVSGKPMIITKSPVDSTQVIRALSEHGEALALASTKKPLDAWKIRSILGIVGQSLQLASAFLRPSRRIDTSVLVFAASNLAANGINLTYDHGEIIDDNHQLRYLKDRINQSLDPVLPNGVSPISTEDKRAALRPADASPKPLDGAKSFLKRYSVQLGESGLRFFGAFALAYPARFWKAAFANKTWPQRDPSQLRVYTGLSSITGKTIALGSAVPDPYNPRPRTWLDVLREKWAFLMGGAIEVTSFSVLAFDAYSKGKIRLNGKQIRDWLGVVGGGLFALAYIVRFWAPFGERQVNVKELYAHTSDSLAQVPHEKLPQLLANTAAGLSEHFDGKQGLNFATIYTNLADDLYRIHTLRVNGNHIDISENNNPHSSNQVPDIALPYAQVMTNGAQLQSAPQSNALAAR